MTPEKKNYQVGISNKRKQYASKTEEKNKINFYWN